MLLQHLMFPPHTPALLLQPFESSDAMGELVHWYTPYVAAQWPEVQFYLTYDAMRKGTTMAEHLFIRYKLDEDEKTQFEGWAENEAEESINLVAEIVADSNKFSIGFDAQNGQYLATISNSKPGNANRGKSVTSRSPELKQAILVACYKHLVIFHEGVWDNRSSTDDWG